MKKFPQFPSIYAISPMQENTIVLLEQIHAAIKGGVRLVQYRDKTLNLTKRIEQAQALRQLCTAHSVLFLINDDVELAKTCHADGVHLGQSDMAIEQARAQLGEQAIIGITCHDSLTLAQQAAAKGADYLSFGCFFPSKTKPNAKPADLAIIKQAKEQFQLPITAIGGITAQNATQVIEFGADLLAIGAGIFTKPDIDHEAREILSIISSK
jgi:thiamine-phosphate pyrophosphorylase